MNNIYKNIKPIRPKSFMEAVAGSGKGYVVLSYTSSPSSNQLMSESLNAADMKSIVQRADVLSKKSPVYFGINRRADQLAYGVRGGNEDVGNISIIGMDIDVSDPEKPDKQLPRTKEEALILLESFILKPSYTLSSGNGVHAYWALSEEIVIESEEQRKQAQDLIRAFYRGFGAFAAPFKFDATHDLSRMLRFPGSLNFKDVNNPKVVEFLTENPERLYSVVDISAAGLAKPTLTLPMHVQAKTGDMDIVRVKDGCSWVKETLEKPSRASYDDWFTIASIFYFAKNGRELFHNWSKGHPDYDPAECDRKFDEVDAEKAKRTCVSIAESKTAFDHCKRCPFNGGIQSPVNLGLPGKRYVVVNTGDLPTKTAQAWAAIYVANEPPVLFRNDAGVLRINNGQTGWDQLDSKSARHEFARLADWAKPAKDGLKPSDPQAIVVDDLLETVNPPLPYLKKVTSIPVITSDGRLVSEFGYDHTSQIYRIRTAELSQLNLGENSRFKDSKEAAQFILSECLSDFPFESEQDKAHALALMLHDFTRNLFVGPSPFVLLDKPIPGSGASLLASVLCYPSLGRQVSMKIFSNSEEEVRKQITTHLMSGGGPYLYDNLPDEKYVDSDSLATVLTTTSWSDRALGTNTATRLQNLGPWIGTGNNPDFSPQLKRRVLRVRLVPENDEPYLRTGFRHEDLLLWVRENRTDLVDACIKIVMEWIEEGRPEWKGKPLGSFEDYSKVIGGILQQAGINSFMANMDYQKDTTNSDTELVRELLGIWWKEKKNANVRASEVVDIADIHNLEIQDKWFDIKDRAKATNAGKYLKRLLDRPCTISTPDGPINVRIVVGGSKGTYRLKEV